MSISREDYAHMTKRISPRSPLWLDCLKAFLVGGAICCFAQAAVELFHHFGVTRDDAKVLAMMLLIVLTALLTALGWFDRLAKHGGAGTAVPITGFANAMVSPTLESKTEGLVLGAAAQMFSIAGPVIVYGCTAASLYGLIYYFIRK